MKPRQHQKGLPKEALISHILASSMCVFIIGGSYLDCLQTHTTFLMGCLFLAVVKLAFMFPRFIRQALSNVEQREAVASSCFCLLSHILLPVGLSHVYWACIKLDNRKAQVNRTSASVEWESCLSKIQSTQPYFQSAWRGPFSSLWIWVTKPQGI